MKFLIAFFCVCNLFAGGLNVEVSAKAAILIDADTGAVLYQKNAFEPMYPASITKIATALYILDQKKTNLNQICRVSHEAIKIKPKNFTGVAPSYWNEIDGSRMGLCKDEEVSIETLFHGLMKVSGNDAANVLAQEHAPSICDFVSEMNEYLKSIGCKNTFFINPHGLHHEDHKTSAFDMSLIARKALQHPAFLEFVSGKSYIKPKSNKQPETEIFQMNALMRNGEHFYSKAIGIKTGYTHASLANLVAAATDKGRTLIAVLLGYESKQERYKDAVKLFETAFAEVKKTVTYFDPSYEFSFQFPRLSAPLKASILEEASYSYYPSQEPNVKCFLKWTVKEGSIKKGQHVGVLEVVDGDGNILSSKSLVASDDLEPTFLEKIVLALF